jgi:hypothetical protein
MRSTRQFGKSNRNAGSALLIAIFALMLISVVGLALVVSSGTDSALAGNYRNLTGGYYAGTAGLEEARGRLLWKNPDYVNKTNAYPALFGGQGIPTFGLTDVLYIVNPVSGETVNPQDSSSPYADTEYGKEFSWGLGGANVAMPANSVSAVAGLPGPSYKWVRINAVTEAALGVDVDGSGSLDSFTPLHYTGTGLTTNSGAGNEALEITAFVYMPDKSTRLLQYVVAPTSLSLNFPAALTLAGQGVRYTGPNSSGFYVNGNDTGPPGTCSTPPSPSVPALGYTYANDSPTVASGAWTIYHPENYTGSGYVPAPPTPATPSISQVSLPPTLQTTSQLESLVQTISQNADVVLTPTGGTTTVPRSALPTTMSPTNPMTVVVNGDLDLTTGGPHVTGYGLLLVTGAASSNPSLSYDPDVTWEGIVLVIGKGTLVGAHLGSGQIDGAMLVAQTRDATTGNPLPSLGPSSASFTAGMGGIGIYYNSCYIQRALSPTSYRLLSFREFTQQN